MVHLEGFICLHASATTTQMAVDVGRVKHPLTLFPLF